MEQLHASENWPQLLGGLWLNIWEYGSAAVGILVLTVLLYKGYHTLKAAGSMELLRGVFSIAVFYLLAYLLRLEFLLWVLDRIIPTFLIILAVILQPELRRMFVQIGRQSIIHSTHKHYQEFKVIKEMIKACELLSDMGRGALIIFRREHSLRHIIANGVAMDAAPSAELMVSMFAYDTPLHDGAAILARSRIVAAACILPIDPEERSLITMKAGTRHRSAMELVRETDAVALIVSEESGRISLAHDGRMRSHLKPEEIAEQLQTLLVEDKRERRRFRLSHLLSFIWPFGGRTVAELTQAKTDSDANIDEGTDPISASAGATPPAAQISELPVLPEDSSPDSPAEPHHSGSPR